MRPPGSGSVYEQDGRWYARLPPLYGRKVIGSYATQQEALDALDVTLAAILADGLKPTGPETLAAYGDRWLARRNGMRSSSTQYALWTKHIAGSSLGQTPLVDLSKRQIREWAHSLSAVRRHDDRGTLSKQTRVHLLNLVRRCLRDAVDDEVIRTNPAVGVQIAAEVTTDPGWRYLLLDQQTALLNACPEPERWIVETALYSGCRKGELWTLHVADVHLDDAQPWLWIRYGGRRGGKLQPPKNGKPRRVPLPPAGADALRRWLEALPEYTKGKARLSRNPHGLVFPGRMGEYRDKSKQPASWRAALAQAGLSIRWHDLRHTCASSLVAGWWGRVWTLQEVREYLGHSSVTVTERYAHLSGGHLASAAAATFLADTAPSDSDAPLVSKLISRSGRLDSNQRLLAPKVRANTAQSKAYEPTWRALGRVAALCRREAAEGRAAYREGRALALLVQAGVQLGVIDDSAMLLVHGTLDRRPGRRGYQHDLVEWVAARIAERKAGAA